MARGKMRTDHRRVVEALTAIAVVTFLALLVPIAGNASYAIGFWLGQQ